jgi:shikimate 5-dehydrogenase
MNAVLGGRDCVYLPVNVTDEKQMEDVCDVAESLGERNAGDNFTTPRKGSPTALKRLARGRGTPNFDVIVHEPGGLTAHSYNGVALREWWRQEGYTFTGQSVAVIGLGGAGGPIAEEIAEELPAQLTVVDRTPKKDLVSCLQRKVPDTLCLTDIGQAPEKRLPSGVIVINATGNGAAYEGSSLQQVLAQHRDRHGDRHQGHFIDIRAARPPIVNQAESLWGWRSFDGLGMSYWNNWMFLGKVATHLKTQAPSLEEFAAVVKRTAAKQALLAA